MENRKTSQSKPSPLPTDYLNMVTEVFHAHFDAALKIYEQNRPGSHFTARGAVCSNEIWIAVSLVSEGKLSGATVYASCDFDPKASAPTAQELLSACVDSIGTVFGTILDEERPETIVLLTQDSSAILDQMPAVWTPMEANQREIFIRFDRSNPLLEGLADEWLNKNDSSLAELENETENEIKKLFVTGPRRGDPSGSHGSGSGMIN
jgi:hypothetical protein